MEGLTEGRWLHYVLPNGKHRPAQVVKVWPNEFRAEDGTPEPGVNLDVHTDYSNDVGAFNGYPQEFLEHVRHGHFWQTSVKFDETTKVAGTCHWIEKA